MILETNLSMNFKKYGWRMKKLKNLMVRQLKDSSRKIYMTSINPILKNIIARLISLYSLQRDKHLAKLFFYYSFIEPRHLEIPDGIILDTTLEHAIERRIFMNQNNIKRYIKSKNTKPLEIKLSLSSIVAKYLVV
jgi:hypothetical protein